MRSLFECIQNLFRTCVPSSKHEHITVPSNVELQENPTVEKPLETSTDENENNLEEPKSDSEDIYADLPPLIPIEYGTDEELEELNSNQSDNEYKY